MKFKWSIAAPIVAILLAGCAGASIGVRTGNSSLMDGNPLRPGSSYSSAAIQAEVSPNVYFGMVFLGAVMLGIQDDYRRWSGGASWREPPQLAEDRAIAERDCSRPMEQTSANLRCK